MFKKSKTNIDYPLFFAVAFLIIFGMIMISSVSIYSSYKLTSGQVFLWLIEDPYNYFYVKRNIIHVITWFILLSVVVKIPFRYFEKISGILLWITTLLLWYVHFFWVTYKWAKWWIDIPLLPFNIQPTELLKISLILFLAYFFKKIYKKIGTLKEWFIPFMFILGFFVLIVWMQPDFWTVMVIVPVSVIMFFLAGANIRYLAVLTLVWMLMSYWIYSAWKYDKWLWEKRPKLAYISERIDYFLDDSKELFNPNKKNNDKTYQTKQALITIWSWGAAGLWFWNSIQKFWYLPEVQWDFIFSVIVEELGFVGAFVLLSLYTFIAWRWFYIYSMVQDTFAKFAAAWISTWFIVQAFINIWVNLNIMPLTWITLPFISYWGSSLLTLMFALWILLSISREVHKKPKFWRLRKRNMI
jgi:cell division protein FtsW